MIGGEISVTIIVFILNYIILEKTNDKMFQKSEKPYFGVIWGNFCPNLGKMYFPGKRSLKLKKIMVQRI